MIEKCCAFTGHRPKKFPWGYDETDVRCVALKRALAGQIVKLADAGYTDFFSGMTEGADYEKRKVMRSETLNTLCKGSKQGNHFA